MVTDHLGRTWETTHDDSAQTKRLPNAFISQCFQEAFFRVENEPVRCIGQPATGDDGF